MLKRIGPTILKASSIGKPRSAGPRVLTKVTNKPSMNKQIKRLNKKMR
jgi:hypothetical protein